MIMESCYKVNHNKNTMAVIEEEDGVADTIHGEDEAVVGITTLNVKGKRTNKENIEMPHTLPASSVTKSAIMQQIVWILSLSFKKLLRRRTNILKKPMS